MCRSDAAIARKPGRAFTSQPSRLKLLGLEPMRKGSLRGSAEGIEPRQSLAVILTALPAMPQHELYWALRRVETQYRTRLLLGESDPSRNRRQADLLRAVGDKTCPHGKLRR